MILDLPATLRTSPPTHPSEPTGRLASLANDPPRSFQFICALDSAAPWRSDHFDDLNGQCLSLTVLTIVSCSGTGAAIIRVAIILEAT